MISSCGFQNRAYDFEWPQLCNLGAKHGNIAKKKGALEIHEDCDSNPKDDQVKFVIDRKKDEVVEVIITYISRDIHFPINGIDCPH